MNERMAHLVHVTLECGHTSMLRIHPTPKGYTHDWEVFVRGTDNADIHHYVEKVVFQLHETFKKPKRILNEPPFVIKESGYASFEMPIHIYLKNKDEGTKKIEILYDLNLSSGPTHSNVIRHNEVFNNPSDDFKRKLLRGGGVLMHSLENSIEKSENKTPTMIGKAKLSGNDSKKYKIESKTSNSFAELFGTPLKPTKVSQEIKKPTQPEKSSTSKPSVTTGKSDKVDKAKLKDSPHKDSKKEKVDDKKDKRVKDQSKDRNRSKEKSKRPPSPGNKSHSSPPNKKPPSPPSVPLKKPPTPPYASQPALKRPPSPRSKERDVKRVALDRERDKSKEKDKAKDSSKNGTDSTKSDKRKDKKKHKDDRDKDRKDKYKEGERSTTKESVKIPEKKSDKPEKSEKSEKEKSQEYKSAKDVKKSPKPLKELEKQKDEKLPKTEKSEKTEKSDKSKDGKSDKDRQRHKHKKRDKKDKRDSSRERKEKRERTKSSSEKQSNMSNAPTITPLSTLLQEMPERDSSDSPPSADDDSHSESKVLPTIKKEGDNLTVFTTPTEMAKPLSPAMPILDIKKEKVDHRIKREKPRGSKGEDTRRRKRRSDSKGDDEPPVKRDKDSRGHSTSPPSELVSSSQSPIAVDQEMARIKEERNSSEQDKEIKTEAESEQVAPDSTNSTLVDSAVEDPPVFSEDYVSQLKDLQQKIMTLQDNDELQRVVQVIAETGQYEITTKTFDFDLCALDRRTVQRLQQFFAS